MALIAESYTRTSQFKLWQVALGVILGLAGLAANLLLVDLGWGLQLLFGSAISLVSLRILPKPVAVAAIAIAALATLIHWHHPWAFLIWTAEAVFLATVLQRLSPIIRDLVFWLVLGTPLLIVSYGGILGFSDTSLWLVVAKQMLNGILNVWLAEIIFALLLYLTPIGSKFKVAALPAADLSMLVIFSLAIAPVPLQVRLSASADEKKLLEFERSELRREVDMFQRRVLAWLENRAYGLQVFAADIVDNHRTVIERASSGPLAEDFNFIVIVDRTGTVIAATDPAPPQITLGARNVLPLGNQVTWRAGVLFPEGAQEASHLLIRTKVPNSDIEILGALPRDRLRSVLKKTSSQDATTIAIVNPYRRIAGVLGTGQSIFPVIQSDHDGKSLKEAADPAVFRRGGFGSSLMSQLSGAVLAYKVPFEALEGWDLYATSSLENSIASAREAQLRILANELAMLAILMGGAWYASRHLAGSLELIGGSLQRLVSRGLAQRSTDSSSRIKEVREIGGYAQTLGIELEAGRNELRSYQERLVALESYAPIIIYSMNIREGRKAELTYVSSSVQRVLGFSPEEVHQSGWWSHRVHPADVVATMEKYRELRPGQLVTAEYRLRRADGQYRWIYDVLTITTGDPDDKAIGYGFILDVTARKDAQLQLVQASKLSALGEIATGLAHELNQPLNVIKLSASDLESRLQRGKLENAGLGRQLASIVAQVDRAAKLIHHLRLFGRYPNESPSAVCVTEAIVGASMLVSSSFDTERISVVLGEIDEQLFVEGHVTLIEQVLLNLLLNARDAIRERRSRASDLQGLIEVAAERTVEGFISITVEDNGGGIGDEAAERLFEPFFTTKPVGKGTGLGLSVSYRIVRDMNGEISSRNTGTGAIFTILVPEAMRPPATADDVGTGAVLEKHG